MDNEVKGQGNQQDYGMRIYDPRLGRFLSVDPLTKDYPWYTPYQFAGNKPIWAVDLDGMEEWMKTQAELIKQKFALSLATAEQKKKEFQLQVQNNYRPALVSVYKEPISDYEKMKQERFRERQFEALGYNPDGTAPFLMRLEKNKHFQKGAENFALPMLEGMTWASGYGELRALFLGAKSLTFPSTATKINFVRDFLGIGKTKNIGFLEGQVGNTKIVDVAISGKNSIPGAVENPVTRIFTTKEVGGYDRLFDSEVKLLENFAQQYKTTPNIQAVLKLSSERPFCESCAGVIEQFKKMFPNVKLEVVNGIK